MLLVVLHSEARKLPDGFDQGKPFKADAPEATSIKDSLPNKTKKYVILRCPKTLPVLTDKTPLKGPVNDTLMDGMRSMTSYHCPWLSLISGEMPGMVKFSEDLQDAILQNRDALGEFFPPQTKNTTFASSVYTTFDAPPSAVNVDSDDELEGADSSVLNAVTALEGAMTDIVCRNTLPPPSPAGPPSAVDVSTADSPEPKDDLPKQSEIERQVAKLSLLTMMLQSDGSVRTFDIRENVLEALNKPKKTMAEVLNNLFRAGAEQHAASLDAIMRHARWPKQYSQMPVVLTLIANAMLSDAPIKDLAQVCTSAAWGLTVGTFLPPNKEAVAAVSEIEDEGKRRELQLLMGEHSSKTKSVSMKMQHSSVIGDRWEIVACCANVSAMCHVLCKFNIQSIDYNEAPHLHVAARKIALAIHSGDYTSFHEDHPSKVPKLNYHCFGLFDRTMVTGGKVLKEEQAITAAMPGRGGGTINPDHAILAKRTLEKGITGIAGILRAAETLESTDAYKNSPFGKAARKRRDGTADEDNEDDSSGDEEHGTRPSRGTKRHSSAGDVGSRKKKPKNIGPIIVQKGMKYLPMPDDKDFPKGETPLCGAKLRNGTKFYGVNTCGNPNCERNHDAIAKWSKNLIKFMIKHVDDTQGISWNPEVATPKILGLKLNKVP